MPGNYLGRWSPADVTLMKGKMIRTAILVILSITISTAVFAAGAAQICVSREENNGILNIRPVEITVNGKHILWISGGEKKCVEIWPGEYRIIAQSTDLYDPNDKNPNTWVSKPILIKVRTGKVANISIFPGYNEKGYSGVWEISQQ